MDSDSCINDLSVAIRFDLGQNSTELCCSMEPSSQVKPELIKTHNVTISSDGAEGVSDAHLREMSVDRGEETLEPTVPRMLSKELAESVTKVTFPFFDPEKLKGLNLELPFPIKQTLLHLPAHNASQEGASVASEGSSLSESRPNNQLVLVSHCRRQARQARQQVLFKIGMRSHSSDKKKLLTAVQKGDIAKVSGLLHSGLSTNCCDEKKRTPLHMAASQGHFAIASLLLAMQADPNTKDILGNTPLHLAVCRGDRHVVRLLIEHGANIHALDNAGRTPLSIVRARLNTLRTDRSISTDKLKGEFLLMWDFLKFHEGKSSTSDSVGDLCHMMETVSTREQADEIADVMINKMSQLHIANLSRLDNHSIL